jgi:hypothetical protein
MVFHERRSPNAKKTNCNLNFLDNCVRTSPNTTGLPYLRRGDSFCTSQNNEILLDRNHTPAGLLPSDEFLSPSLPKNSEISHIVGKVLIYIFWQRCSMFYFRFLDNPCRIFEIKYTNNFSGVFFPRRIFYLSSYSSTLRRFGRMGWYGRTNAHLVCTSL